MKRVLAAVVFAAFSSTSAAAQEPPAAAASVDEDVLARVGLSLLAAGAALSTGTMTAYAFLSAEPTTDDDEAWPFGEDGPTREQTAGLLGVSGGAAGIVLLLSGVAILVGTGGAATPAPAAAQE